MIISNVLKQILADYFFFNIQASFQRCQRVSQIELRVTPSLPGNRIM